MIDESGHSSGFGVVAMTALEDIKKALEGVTPGPWEVYSEKVADKAAAIAESAYQVEHTEPFVGEIFMLNAGGKCPALTGCGPCSEANARYIAAVNPAAISELLSTLESLQRENEEKSELARTFEAEANQLREVSIANRHRAERAEAELKRLEEWKPISEADKSIVHIFDVAGLSIANSLPIWARDEDGRVYEALWSDNGKKAYWWDIEGESPVDPVEFMPHPLARTALASTGGEHNAE